MLSFRNQIGAMASCVLLVAVALFLSRLPCARADFQRDSNGWTILAPSASSVTIHVSSSGGDDSNDGLTPATAVKTVSRGKSLIRDNSNDFLLFKRGDTWNESFGSLVLGGISAEQPLVFSSYGSGDRPLFNTGSSHGARMWSASYADSHGGGYNNIVFKGLHFKAGAWTGAQSGDNPSGFRIDRPGQNLLFEDMYVEGYASNFTVQAVGSIMGQNVQIRRSVIVDAFAKRYVNGLPWLIPGGGGATDNGYVGGSHSQGIYADRIDGLLIEENVIDHNGWKEGVAGAERTIFSHNLYLQSGNTSDITIRGNIIANGAAHAAQLRPGGNLENNLFIGNGTGAFIGGAGGKAEGNVFLHSSNDDQWALSEARYGGSGPRNWGLDMKDIPGSEAYRNLLLDTPDGKRPLVGLSGVSTEGNLIYKWGTTSLSYDSNVYPTPFPDPNRTVATYDTSLGGAGSVESFLAAARLQSQDNWDLKYTADRANRYFLAGFLDPEVLGGDFNGNGVIDGNDLPLWETGYGMQQGADFSDGDANGDGVVDGVDFLIWQQDYLAGSQPSAAESVPEPSTAWLALCGLLFLGLCSPL